MADYREILAAALEIYLKEKTFPEVNAFRLKYENNWSESHDDFQYLLDNWFFNKNERSHYVLRLKALQYINNGTSNAIIATINSLIPTLHSFYRKDQTDNKYWSVDEIAYEAQCDKDDVAVALFFMQDIYYLNCSIDPKNKMLCTSVSIRIEFLKVKSVEEWLKRVEEREASNSSVSVSPLLLDLQGGLKQSELNDEAPNFSTLIADKNLVNILRNRWDECDICVRNNAPLAAVIMMGGLVESLLLIKVKSAVDQLKIQNSKSAPKDKNRNVRPYSEWSLAHLIELSSELDWITKPTRDISAVLKEYRNFIHPHREHAAEVKISAGDSKLFWAVSKEIVRQIIN